MKRGLVYGLAALAVAGFLFTVNAIFYGTPIDKMLLFNQKIFYYHVPCAFMLFAAVIICGIASVLYLKRRKGRYDDIALAAGELSVVFGAIVLITGSLWGKAAWNVWWQWDARLTTSLLLWMTMVGYVLVRKFGGPAAQRLAAGLGVFGMANVPLIYFSVKIWRTLHPKTSVVPLLKPAMRSTFWISVLLFLGLFILLMIARVATTRAARELGEVEERALDAGLL